ncbi:MAG TPA: hypothetical protein VES66_07060, partial [Terriglobales bacterium]|nr:hypothetical protein [Terriglobales bacterium]
MTSIVHLFLLFTLASVSLAADTAHLRQEEDIREAVFRYQFDHNASAQQKNANAYCLSVGEKDGDPSDRFMKRFAGHRPPVRKASACIASDRVVDKRTAKPGLLFRVSIITWISDTEAKVAGGYY